MTIKSLDGNYRCPSGLYCRLMVDWQITQGKPPCTNYMSIVWQLMLAGF